MYDDSGTKHATIDYNADVIQLEIGVGRGDDRRLLVLSTFFNLSFKSLKFSIR